MKRIATKLIPKFVFHLYHLAFAYLGAFMYGFPSRGMIVVGVLGTRGKTTIANLLWSVLTSAGYKTGLTGTANIRIGLLERLNKFHMTMPGRFTMQKMLAEMRKGGCRFAIVETPSEGVEQSRHIGIAYDAIIMASLYPEYLETHGRSFERCKEMHIKPFRALYKQPGKVLNGKKVPKIIVVNNYIAERDLFLKNRADVRVTYGAGGTQVSAENISEDENDRPIFSVGSVRYSLGIRGIFNVQNALAAIACASALGIQNQHIKEGIEKLKLVPGRMEEITDWERDFSVFVDYAHDAVSFEAMLGSSGKLKKSAGVKLIVIIGAEGGGRDREKRPVMGGIAAKYADIVIVTNVDSYHDDPMLIIEEVARGAESAGKERDKNLLLELDRREAIRRAFKFAGRGDVVIITGKGSEQSMETKDGRIPWDDRTVAREELEKISP